MSLKRKKPSSNFNKITIGLASPEAILQESYGEVLKPETINYRTHKPERDGLFCERIFGPIKDYECACGKYKRIRYKGIICDRCGVEITDKNVRRDRIGHIRLVIPVVHIWYFKALPNKIGYLLDFSSKKLDMIIYYERYLVIQVGAASRPDQTPIEKLELLTENEYLSIIERLPLNNQELDDKDPNKFIAMMGAKCIEELLKRLNLDDLADELRNQSFNETSKLIRMETLKRLQVVEAFKYSANKLQNRREWMVVHILPIIPPELRPLVPLAGGRFATSDLNDLYRKIIIRNNRLKRLLQIDAPEVIIRNEKRMLQEAVDSLYDNTKKSYSIKSEGNRPLKSLSDFLKGKQGRFRQNLLGKRVDYSARSVIVVGPKLKLHECGIPKDMAAELYKPFIIRKLIERGLVKTVKSAKKMIDTRKQAVWEILENILKGHPLLLNRAPTLHKLGIQAFQPKLIEGKAIQLHPLVCTAFNADFDGDQMAVHLPLGPLAILEAQLLMFSSQNILNPANGSPITVPSQDMVLGLYYMTKELKSTPYHKVKGEGIVFYSPEEVQIAYNANIVSINACIKVKVPIMEQEHLLHKIVETTVGRVLFNKFVPIYKVGYINELLTKKSLRDIIGRILTLTNIPVTVKFLDDIKELGFYNAFKGGFSFSLKDIIIPNNKRAMIKNAIQQIDSVIGNYNMGLITNQERYNQVIDIWTSTNAMLTEKVMSKMQEDKRGFNSVYMMLDSGARGSKEQIRQLSGMRGLMAKPQRTGGGSGEIIENPIISNFREGLSILEYFISTHGARKGLADTALKTADAGYLTRRLVDVAQDVIIREENCLTIRGLEIGALKKNEEIVESLYDRILGRIALYDIYHPNDDEVIVSADEMIDEECASLISKLGIEIIYVRSPLTCESKSGICAKCYGRNLSTGKLVQKGEAVGVIAAQSIGEPGTQLTLRTFHVGGTAGNIVEATSQIFARDDGIIELEDLRSIYTEDEMGKVIELVVSRYTEMKLINRDGSVLMKHHIPYGASLFVKQGNYVNKGAEICRWDPYNAVIISERSGIISYEAIEKGVTFQIEDEQAGIQEKVILESRDKNIVPSLKIISDDEDKREIKIYNMPVGAHLVVDNGDRIKVGKVIAKIPRKYGKMTDITGGLPRVTELCEARNPSNLGIVSDIDGVVSFGNMKRGNREIFIENKTGEIKKYLVRVSSQIVVQENDYVKAGTPLSEGTIAPDDILNIKGPKAVQEYIVNEIQEVYRLQGVKINNKHFEIIVRQMMLKVKIVDAGDSCFLEDSIEHKTDFIEENNRIFGMKVVEDPGDSEKFKYGQLLNMVEYRNENDLLESLGKKNIITREVIPATAKPILQGITRAALHTKSFVSAASFQETTKVLNEAAISGKTDDLLGLKENVIVGHKIPAGTGLREYQDFIVFSKLRFDEIPLYGIS
ncbi:DNA-directed RNA polymerase subunit beta' [Candidatus Uzinura diaspidicola str. ASNER]|uniref:DNA-directed RNA polymerase subunit beta' n=1 Tax=Candidatus Uzinura diaspidicola str. ASNER TaxID=1133592 RepID=L7VMM4_9FLAO|nr:DNA-directed RNA polymerase subunit beta' [Candidatus Uzinura diaspidicola str. ASNER]